MNTERLTYQNLKKRGWKVFAPLASQCLTYCGDTNNSNSRFVIVLCSEKERENALILTTAATAENFAQRLQNIENDINMQYRFVNCSRDISNKETLDSFLEDAKQLNVDKISGNNSELDIETTAISKFKAVVSDAISRGASDIHWWVEPNSSRVALRIDGDMSYEKGYNKHESREMISAVLQEFTPGFKGYESDSRPINLPIDLHVNVSDSNGGSVKEKVRLRLNRNGSKDREGYKATLRIQRTDRSHSDLSTLNYEPWMEKKLFTMLNEPYGIFVATGKVGSGKSTTIKAMIELLPHSKSGISIEDPIEFEYDHPNIHPVQVDDSDVRSTLEALLHSSLRQDPDFINVSEIRTPRVAEDVLGHARVGCVMSSTLHTNDAITSFDRLCELGISPKELANTDLFLGFLSQRLVKRLCPDCSTALKIESKNVFVRNSDGCNQCDDGYLSGRTAVAELLIPEEDDSVFIERKDWVVWRKHLLSKGFKTMAIRALELTEQRQICYFDAVNGIPSFKNVNAHIELYQKD